MHCITIYRCNKHGVCIRCTCVKSGRSCSNCYPSRNGMCKNISSVSMVRPAVVCKSSLTINISTFPLQIVLTSTTIYEEEGKTLTQIISSIPLPFNFINGYAFGSHISSYYLPPYICTSTFNKQLELSAQMNPSFSSPFSSFGGNVSAPHNPTFLWAG